MIRVDENVINLVEKLRRAIRNGNISPDIFPMGEINNLMECTLGESFWESCFQTLTFSVSINIMISDLR